MVLNLYQNYIFFLYIKCSFLRFQQPLPPPHQKKTIIGNWEIILSKDGNFKILGIFYSRFLEFKKNQIQSLFYYKLKIILFMLLSLMKSTSNPENRTLHFISFPKIQQFSIFNRHRYDRELSKNINSIFFKDQLSQLARPGARLRSACQVNPPFSLLRDVTDTRPN